MMQAMELFRARIGVGSLTGGAPLIAIAVLESLGIMRVRRAW
jgi:hypothetical protein